MRHSLKAEREGREAGAREGRYAKEVHAKTAMEERSDRRGGGRSAKLNGWPRRAALRLDNAELMLKGDLRHLRRTTN